jgi:hypothetical protein
MRLLCILLLILGLVGPAQSAVDWLIRDFSVLMNTHGEISFAPYAHGDYAKFAVQPGYRSDFKAYVDFFNWKGLVSNWLIANTTIIERDAQTSLRLDKIRYTLTPGYRYEFENHLISGLLLHECMHTISKPEENGAVWWNSFQFGFGSKSSYQMYLVDKYLSDGTTFFSSFDYQVNVGAFLHGKQSEWIGQNHDYRFETFYLLRMHIAHIGIWGVYADWNHHVWQDKYREHEHKMDLSLHLLLRGLKNIAALYYQYFVYDTFAPDNQDGLGAVGFKIVF